MLKAADLFHSIATQKQKVGVIPSKKFITRLRREMYFMTITYSKMPMNS